MGGACTKDLHPSRIASLVLVARIWTIRKENTANSMIIRGWLGRIFWSAGTFFTWIIHDGAHHINSMDHQADNMD